MRFSRCFFSRAFSWANRRGEFLRQTRPVHGGKQGSNEGFYYYVLILYYVCVECVVCVVCVVCVQIQICVE